MRSAVVKKLCDGSSYEILVKHNYNRHSVSDSVTGGTTSADMDVDVA